MWKNCIRLESSVSLISWRAINLISEVVFGSLEWVWKRNGMVIPWPRSGMVIHLNWWMINSLQKVFFSEPNVNMSVFVWEDKCFPSSLQWSKHCRRPSTLFHIFWMFIVYDLCLREFGFICHVWFCCHMLLFFVFKLQWSKCLYLLWYQRVPNLIGGSFVDSQSSEFIDVINPVSDKTVQPFSS